jgi:HAD superfamily hydrolase (TIGR01490 family)
MVDRKNQKGPGAFFDLDLTITNRDSFRYFLKEHYLRNVDNWRVVPHVLVWAFLRKLRFVSLQRSKENALVALKGKPYDFIREIGRSFSETALINCVRDEATQRIEWHREKGHRVFIVTASPDIYLASVTQYLRCDGYLSSVLAYRKGKFIGRFEGKDCIGSEKAKRIKSLAVEKSLNLKMSFAYSDHESDLPMLELVGNPITVSPTKKLLKIARERDWRIEKW